MRTKTKFYNKLNYRILIILVILLSIVGLLITIFDSNNIRNIYEKSYTDKLLFANSLIAGSVDEEAVAYYVNRLLEEGGDFQARQLAFYNDRELLHSLKNSGAPQAEQDAVFARMQEFYETMEGIKQEHEYYAIVERLQKLRDLSQIKYVYIYADTGVRNADGEILYTYIFDAEDNGDYSRLDSDGLGMIFTYDESAETVFTTGQAMEKAEYYDEEPYGKLYFAYSPIIADGEVIAIVGTDMAITGMDEIIANSVTTNTVIFSSITIIVGVFLYIFLSRQVSKPLADLTRTAESLADGDIYAAVPEEVLKISHEIGQLAQVIDETGAVYRDMIGCTGALFKEAIVGRLAARNDVSRFKGGIAQAVELTNAVLDAISLYLNGMPESVFIIGKNLDMYFANEQAARDFGDISADGLLRCALEAEGAEPEVLIGELERVLAEENYSRNVWLHDTCYSFVFREIAIDDGQENSVLAVAVDVTDLMREKVNAQSASVAKSEFLSRVSHELRTPMNVILGMSQLGIKEAKGAALERFRQIDSASRQLLAIINDVLDMSRIESGKLEQRPEPFELRQLIRDAAEMFKAQAAEKELNLLYTVAEDIPDALIGDAQRLRQIIINLVGNALKFTENGGITLLAELSGSSGKEVFLTFRVQDTGIGMSPEFLKKVFMPFEQEEIYLQRKQKGTGLGLPICKNLVEMMGGKITVKSVQGKGSEFIFELPFEVSEPAAPGDGALTDPLSADLNGMKVLVVDDIDINREIFIEMLADEGLVITECEDGEDAVALFEESPAGTFDIIFMDIQMVRMNGYEATRRIRALNRADSNLPIIAMTANALKQDVDNALAAGMNGHVAKPIDFDACLEIMRKFRK